MKKYLQKRKYPARTEKLRQEVQRFGDFHRLKQLSGLSLATITNFARGSTYFIRAETVWALQEALRLAPQKQVEVVPVKPRARGWQAGYNARRRQLRGKKPLRRSVARAMGR